MKKNIAAIAWINVLWFDDFLF